MEDHVVGRWVAANAIGELLGLGGGALLAAVALAGLEALIGVVPAAIVSAIVFGLVEGAVVGSAQHLAMRPLPRRPDRRSWVLATVTGGTVAWLAVSIPFALLASGADASSVTVDEPPLLAQLALMPVVGAPAGAVLGVPQALALRSHTARPWRWVGANAVAWAAGLPVVQLVAGGLPSSPSVGTVVAVATLGLLAAGAIVGAIHGPTLRRLLSGAETAPTSRPVPMTNAMTMWWIRTAPAPIRPRRLTIVEYISSAGRRVTLPVVAVPTGAGGAWVVAVGRHQGKRWWRRFSEPVPAELTDRDGRRAVVGALACGAARGDALAAYLADQPRARARLDDATPVVVFHPVHTNGSDTAATSGARRRPDADPQGDRPDVVPVRWSS